MDITFLKMKILTQTAICALKNAYEECSDKTAKESIFTASKAIILLSQDLEKHTNPAQTTENGSDDDPSEYCMAV